MTLIRYIKLFLISLFILQASSFADEVISGFEEKDLPVLNEELRKARQTERSLQAEIDSLQSDIAAIQIIPVGTVTSYAGSTAPTGWLLCDGSAVSRTTYSALFTVISTTYGVGDGTTTFNVPNAKGRATIGAGQGSTYANGVDAAGTDFALAASGGMEKHKMIEAEMPNHRHFTNIYYAGSGATGYIVSSGSRNAGSAEVYTDYKGSGTAHNNLQPYLVLNYIIKT